MTNILAEWIKIIRFELESKGFVVTLRETDVGSCTSADIDSDKVIGTICYWEPNRFEFQFNDCDSERVLCLETAELDNVAEVSSYLGELLTKIEAGD